MKTDAGAPRPGPESLSPDSGSAEEVWFDSSVQSTHRLRGRERRWRNERVCCVSLT